MQTVPNLAIDHINDWGNIGWKLHLPVEASYFDPLTKDICTFLNQKYGISTPNKESFHAIYDDFSLYKIGSGGKSSTGKGMTIYSASQTMEEAFGLAAQIHEKFGQRLSQTNFPLAKEYQLFDRVAARFVLDEGDMSNYCLHKGFGQSTGTLFKISKKIDPTLEKLKNNQALRNEFLAGYSMLSCIDTCGTLITGKSSHSLPKVIQDAFGDNFLKEYPDLLKELPQRIEKGNIHFTQKIFENLGGGKSYSLEDMLKERVTLGHELMQGRISAEYYKKMTKEILPQRLGKYNFTHIANAKVSFAVSLGYETIQKALLNIAQNKPAILKNIVENWHEIVQCYPQLKPISQQIPLLQNKKSVSPNFSTWVNDVLKKHKLQRKKTLTPQNNIQSVVQQAVLNFRAKNRK